MIILKLFLVFSKISALAIGGAYSFVPMIQREVVENNSWLTEKEFLDIFAATRVFPGAISVGYATYTGYKIGGVLGAISANLGNIIVPSVMLLGVLHIYYRYKDLPRVQGASNMIHLAVFALIMAVAFKMVNVENLMEIKSLIVIIISFALFIYANVHPGLIIIAAGIIGALI